MKFKKRVENYIIINQIKKILFIILLVINYSCNSTYYIVENNTQTSGVDFSKGKWLLGKIEVDSEMKDELTQLAFTNFSESLNDRIKNTIDEKSLLLPYKMPFHPNKSFILDLKKSTNFDYFINIKFEDERNDLKNFNFVEHSYYKKQMTFARVTIEIYDLNLGEIIYNQSVSGSIDEDSSITFKPKRKVILGCYNKIINILNSKSLKN